MLVIGLFITFVDVNFMFVKHGEVVIEVLLGVGASLGTEGKDFLQKLLLESFREALALGQTVESF